MKQLELTVRVRNNLLLERRRSLGFSQAQLASAAGLPLGTYAALERLEMSPVSQRSNDWGKPARLLADFYEVSPEDLFPNSVLEVRQPVVRKTMDVDELVPELIAPDVIAALPCPGESFVAQELRDRLTTVLKTLTPREKRIVAMRFGLEKCDEHTLEEIGEREHVTRSRIRQIEAKALRKLRHPSRAKRLKAYWFANGEDPT